jgi:hypothetical protein
VGVAANSIGREVVSSDPKNKLLLGRKVSDVGPFLRTMGPVLLGVTPLGVVTEYNAGRVVTS